MEAAQPPRSAAPKATGSAKANPCGAGNETEEANRQMSAKRRGASQPAFANANAASDGHVHGRSPARDSLVIGM